MEEKKLEKIVWDMLKQMYKEATPSADLDVLREKGITKNKGWYENYYLASRRQEEIIDETIKKYKLRYFDVQKLKGAWLDISPIGLCKIAKRLTIICRNCGHSKMMHVPVGKKWKCVSECGCDCEKWEKLVVK